MSRRPMKQVPTHRRVGIGFRHRAILRPLTVAFAAATLLAACSGDKGTQAVSESGDMTDVGSGNASNNEADQEIPDACTFLDGEEISAAIGRELREGEPQSTADGASECRFETALGLEASRSYDDPVVPETALASVTINTHPSNAEEFDIFRESLGSEAEVVADIGDGAYFWGPDLIYVRVANRGFSLRVSADESDAEALRAALLRLAEAGASSY